MVWQGITKRERAVCVCACVALDCWLQFHCVPLKSTIHTQNRGQVWQVDAQLTEHGARYIIVIVLPSSYHTGRVQ